jgi:hypothetical protein
MNSCREKIAAFFFYSVNVDIRSGKQACLYWLMNACMGGSEYISCGII